MRILWLCSVPLPEMARLLSLDPPVSGGWLQGLAYALARDNGQELTICFADRKISEIKCGSSGSYNYIALPVSKAVNTNIDVFSNVLDLVNPDIIHIHGTEYPESNAMAVACELRGYVNQTILSIQGLVSVIPQHFAAGIPVMWQYRRSLRDLYKDSSIRHQCKDLVARGVLEIDTIKRVSNMAGRTDWDKACTSRINPSAVYFICNEALRPTFYKYSWQLNKCKKHSIFISQGDYPVKGLHFLLEALPEILAHYPDTMVYVGGRDPLMMHEGFKGFIKRSGYGRYIAYLIKNLHLQDHIVFTGILNEQSMCQRYLDSHVFVSPSTIENSPNSVGEAMILGVPIVTSDVGGVKNMLTHEKEGFIYQHDAPYMLAYYVMRLFEDDDLANLYSRNAVQRASITHDPIRNSETMVSIYKTIAGMIK